MKDKAKLCYRIAAFLFAGSIMTATLTGCMYGPPPEKKTSAVGPEKDQRSEISLVVNTDDEKNI